MKQPHLVILMADQLRYDLIRPEITPAISSLFSQSVVFPNHYCASPLCVPARGSFFTGLYPNETGSIINPWEPRDAEHGNVRAGIPNLYELMEHSWASFHTGKQHFYTAPSKLELRRDSPTAFLSTERTYSAEMKARGIPHPGGPRFRGYYPEMAEGRTTRVRSYSAVATGCYQHGFDNYQDAYFARQAVRAIDEHDGVRPLLLNLAFLAPHPPYDVPEPFFSRHPEIELPENVGRWYRGQSPLQLYNYPGISGTRIAPDQWKEVWRVYAGLVGLLDHCVGLVIEALKQKEMYDDSLIIFTSDHGEMLGSHRLWQKMCMYEESIRVPISFKPPSWFASAHGVRPRTNETRVSAIDFLPTICELCSIQTPATVSGRSLVDLFTSEEPSQEDRPLFLQFDGNGARGNFQRCVIRGRYKLIVDIFKDEIFLELYDIEADPQETTNLAFDSGHAEVVDALIEDVRQYMTRTGDLLPPVETTHTEFLATYGPYFTGYGFLP